MSRAVGVMNGNWRNGIYAEYQKPETKPVKKSLAMCAAELRRVAGEVAQKEFSTRLFAEPRPYGECVALYEAEIMAAKMRNDAQELGGCFCVSAGEVTETSAPWRDFVTTQAEAGDMPF